VKRVKRETAPSSESAQCILAWRSEDSVEKREKQPRRGPARQWRQRDSRNGTKVAAAKMPGAMGSIRRYIKPKRRALAAEIVRDKLTAYGMVK